MCSKGVVYEGVKKELQETLKEHPKGVQRVSSMLINEQDKSMEDINLGMNNFQWKLDIIYIVVDTETKCGLFYVS